MVSVIDHYFLGNHRDCQDKLRDCVAKYKDKWVFLSSYVEEGIIFARYISENEQFFIDLRRTPAEELSIGPYSLGMANAGPNKVYYLSRTPVRKNRLGLRQDNMSIEPVSHIPDIELRGRNELWAEVWRGPEFPIKNVLDRQYPKYLQICGEMAKFQRTAGAFDPHFCIVAATARVGQLKYKTNVVGEVALSTGEISLYPSSSHLVQRLQAYAPVTCL
jgi:hypothetical protein